MTPRTPQCKVFWALLSSSEHSGVPKDSKSLTFPSVGLHPHTWPKWGCDTFCLLTFGSRFCFPVFALPFHVLSLNIFFLSSSKKKKTQRKKNHREEKTCKEGKELTFKLLLCPLTFDSHFCFLVLHFHFKCFILTSFFYQVEGKKNHREKKNAKKGREFTFKLLFCPFTFGSRFCFITFAFLFQALSLSIFFFSSKKEKQRRKKNP